MTPVSPDATSPTRRQSLRGLATLLVCASAVPAALMGARLAHATDATPLRVTAIPDEAPTELQRKFAPLGEHLSRILKRPVVFTPTTDYAATVEALVHGRVDLAWLGGFTLVQARARSKGGVLPIAQRAEDARFRSVFITRQGSGIRTLADLKGRTLSFGSPSSTSGHLMPRNELLSVGKIDPERDLSRIAFSGAHDATVVAVASGKVDAGALNISVWEKLSSEGKLRTDTLQVFHTTAPYHDYNWSVRPDMAPGVVSALTQAFLDLQPDQPADRAILDLQRASRFIPAQVSDYDAIEQVARSTGLLEPKAR